MPNPPEVNPIADVCRLLSRPIPAMARAMIPDLADALPALVLYIRVTQVRLEALERRNRQTPIDLAELATAVLRHNYAKDLHNIEALERIEAQEPPPDA